MFLKDKIIPLSKILISNFIIFFLLILFIDKLLFYFPELFPKKFVRHLSKETQIKYYKRSLKSSHIHMIYEDYIYYYRPNIYIEEHNMSSDSFGYKNPDNLIDKNINILIVGDSFTEAPEMGNNFRKLVDPNTYSIGIGGQGVFHWKYHLKRFYENYRMKIKKIVILNYYEGNDIQDSLRAIEVIKQIKSINSIYYPVSSYYDIEKIKKEKGLFKEIDILYKVLVRDTVSRNYYLLKQQFKNFVKKIIKWEGKNSSSGKLNRFQFKFNKNCIITLDREKHKYDHKFSKKDYNFIKNEIFEAKQIINAYSDTDTKIYLSFIPSAQSTYINNKKVKKEKNYKYKDNFTNYTNHIRFIKSIAEDLEIIFINSSEKIQEIAIKEPLHKCNKNDSHFNEYGYSQYVKILKELI